MSINNSEKSIESLSEDNIFTSQNTQNRSQKTSNIKEGKKDIVNISNQNSGEEELIKNKLLISKNDLELPEKLQLNSNEINPSKKPPSLAFSLSPIKKGKKKNILLDIMQKSKKSNAPKKSVIFLEQEIKLKNENDKKERKDGYGVPINKRNKKIIKVTFTDTLNTVNSKSENNQLAEIIPIASYKKYNYIEGMEREENIAINKSTCQCCLIY